MDRWVDGQTQLPYYAVIENGQINKIFKATM